MAKPRRAPRAPAPPGTPSVHPESPGGDVFRGRVVTLDELEATLNAWHADGFTDLAWEFLYGPDWGDDGASWTPWKAAGADGAGAGVRVFAWGWRE